MYRVIKHFTDLQDDNHPYEVGDAFPREGLKVSGARIAELSGKENKQHCPLIEKVEDPEKGEDEPVKADTGKTKAAEK